MSNKKFNVGDKVRYIGKNHKEMPEFYPEIGTVGTVVEEGGDTDWYIQWPKGSTSRKDCWYCNENDIELVENVDMTNEEIWKMLRPKFNKNNLEGNYVRIDRYGYIKEDAYNAIALAYKAGYLRAMKGRPFKIGEKKAEVEGKKGDKVCWFSDYRDIFYHDKKGTIGTINSMDDCDTLWVYWPVGSCEANKNGSRWWCCAKNQCLLIDTNVKKGDRIVYLGTKHGFLCNDVWPDRVATGVVDWANDESCMVFWDNPDVVTNRYNGHTYVWYEDIAKVIPWD